MQTAMPLPPDAPPPDVLDDGIALADALRPALYRLYRALRRESGALGITPLQNLILAAIAKTPGIGVAALAQQENLRGPTISGHIKALEAARLVTRAAPDLRDRRRTGLLVTAEGRHLVDTLRRRRRDWLAAQLAALPPEARQAIRAAIAPLNRLGQ